MLARVMQPSKSLAVASTKMDNLAIRGLLEAIIQTSTEVRYAATGCEIQDSSAPFTQGEGRIDGVASDLTARRAGRSH